MKKHKTRILILDRDDPDREFDMELAYWMSLTTQERYKIMVDRSRAVIKRLIEIGYINPNEIITRPANSNRRWRKTVTKRNTFIKRQQPKSRLKRPRYPMPAFIQRALVQHRLERAYRSRPPYQQNDYIGWITRAKRRETQSKRLAQMLDELARGDQYMKMAYRPKRK